MLRFFVVIGLCLSLSSCFRMMFGIKDFDSVSNELANKYALRWDIDTTKNYLFIDTAKFNSLITGKGFDKVTLNDIQQPLQWQFYDSTGKLKCFLPNCKVGGFPNLKWEREWFFSTYPPQNSNCPANQSIMLDELFSSCKKLNKELSLGKNNVVVFWSVIMGRQTKRMVESLNNYFIKYPDADRKVVFINVDELLL